MLDNIVLSCFSCRTLPPFPVRLSTCLCRLSLEVMTILCRCENIETSEGVPLDVTGVAQVMQPSQSKPKQQQTNEHN